jgi:hypothetical protein
MFFLDFDMLYIYIYIYILHCKTQTCITAPIPQLMPLVLKGRTHVEVGCLVPCFTKVPGKNYGNENIALFFFKKKNTPKFDRFQLFYFDF